jgi:hypothetical protein
MRLRKGREMKNPTPTRPTTKSEPIDESRLTEELSLRIDAWIATQPDPRPSRPEAIRRLLAEALGKTADADAKCVPTSFGASIGGTARGARAAPRYFPPFFARRLF